MDINLYLLKYQPDKNYKSILRNYRKYQMNCKNGNSRMVNSFNNL